MKDFKIIVTFCLSLLAVFIFYVQALSAGSGMVTFAFLWNLVPLGLSLLFIWMLRSVDLRALVPAVTFAWVSTGFVAWFHLAWLRDLDGIATSSSTAAVAFVFVPIWAVLFATTAASGAWVVVAILRLMAEAGVRYRKTVQ